MRNAVAGRTAGGLSVWMRKRRRAFDVRIRFDLARGGGLVLTGASGAGKSTVLAAIAGFESLDEGEIVFEGQRFEPPPLALHLRGVGYLAQAARLFPHLNVGQNVMLGAGREPAAGWVEELRTRLGLSRLWQASPSGISRGEARRAALARALARRPLLVLLDEPLAGLDPETAAMVVAVIEEWRRRLELTLIVTDHAGSAWEGFGYDRVTLAEGRVATPPRRVHAGWR